MLRDGGRIVLTVPFSARWRVTPHYDRRDTPSSLRNLLEGAGFSEVVVHARGDERTVACSKLMALILPALFPQGGGLGGRRVAAGLGLPVLALLAAFAQLTLRGDGGDDCLGWTATALAN